MCVGVALISRGRVHRPRRWGAFDDFDEMKASNVPDALDDVDMLLDTFLDSLADTIPTLEIAETTTPTAEPAEPPRNPFPRNPPFTTFNQQYSKLL